MRCLQCNFEGSFVEGRCTRCGSLQPVNSGLLHVQTRRSISTPLPALRTPTAVTLHSTQQAPTLGPGYFLKEGRYHLKEKLSGTDSQQMQGVGASWLAGDTRTRPERLVVIREVTFPAALAQQRSQIVQNILQRLREIGQHPALPAVLDTFFDERYCFIVFEHFEGMTLSTLTRKQGGALSERQVAEYGRQLCEILTFFARQRPVFIHGSISPDTITISPDRMRVSLTQLPLYAVEDTPRSSGEAGSSYAAPEQMRGQTVPASDLYSVAAVMHHAVTGYDPRQRLNFFYPPARRLNPNVTPRMEELLSRELHLSIAQRYPRPSDMQTELTAMISSYSPLDSWPQSGKNTDRLRQPEMLQLRAQSRNRTLMTTVGTGFVGILALLVIFAFMFGSVFMHLLQQNQQPSAAVTVKAAQATALKQELFLEDQAYVAAKYGLSDGRYMFDLYDGRSATALPLKREAALAMQRLDYSTAINRFTAIISADPLDAEVRIYDENLRILQSGAPYVTLVLGVNFNQDPNDLATARGDAQGAFIAQQEINSQSLLPNKLKLRILLANSGAGRDYVGRVAQFVADRVNKAGNPDHIIGLAGWAYSGLCLAATSIVASAHIPMVSNTASSVRLSGTSPYFFRVNPSDATQGQQLGLFAAKNAKNVLLVRDPTEPYSVSLADAFLNTAKANNVHVINTPDNTFKAQATSVEGFQKIVNNAMLNQVDIIFLSGFGIDSIHLAHAIGLARKNFPFNLTLKNLRIVGGDGLSLNLASIPGADGQLVRTYPAETQIIFFTSFSSPDAWKRLNVPQKEWPVFFTEWQVFRDPNQPANDAGPASSDAMLTYDAMQVLTKATTLVKGPLTGQSVRDALLLFGKGDVPAFQGVSGLIMFDDKGDPVNKAVDVLQYVAGPNGVNVQQLEEVVGKLR